LRFSKEIEEDLKRAAVSLGEYIEKKKGTLPGTGEWTEPLD